MAPWLSILDNLQISTGCPLKSSIREQNDALNVLRFHFSSCQVDSSTQSAAEPSSTSRTAGARKKNKSADQSTEMSELWRPGQELLFKVPLPKKRCNTTLIFTLNQDWLFSALKENYSYDSLDLHVCSRADEAVGQHNIVLHTVTAETLDMCTLFKHDFLISLMLFNSKADKKCAGKSNFKLQNNTECVKFTETSMVL